MYCKLIKDFVCLRSKNKIVFLLKRKWNVHTNLSFVVYKTNCVEAAFEFPSRVNLSGPSFYCIAQTLGKWSRHSVGLAGATRFLLLADKPLIYKNVYFVNENFERVLVVNFKKARHFLKILLSSKLMLAAIFVSHEKF